MSGRLFLLEISGGGRVVSMEPDGSGKAVLVSGGRLPDGIAVDATWVWSPGPSLCTRC